jgi:hypothetical protein
MPSDPSVESDDLSIELSFVIGLLIFLLSAPAFLAIILRPSAQSAFRDVFAALRNTKIFNSIFAKPSSSMQSISLEANGSSEALNIATGLSRSEDMAPSRDQLEKTAPPVNLNQIDADSDIFSDGSQLSARRTTLPYPSTSEISHL